MSDRNSIHPLISVQESDFSLNKQHNNNSKQLAIIAGRNTADFSVFPPGAGVFFFAKKDPPEVNSKKIGGGIFKKKKVLAG